jgi:hypothetical protein
MFILDGKPLSPDVAFTHEGIQYPANWLRLATPEERAAIGITEQADPPVWDQRFAWGYSEDGQLIWKDHTQLVEQWVAQTRTTAGTLLAPTDWVIIREADNGKAADPALKQLREDIRLATGQKNAAIEATTDTAELAAYITGSEYPVWPSDSPAPVEPAPVDGLEPTGDQPEE